MHQMSRKSKFLSKFFFNFDLLSRATTINSNPVGLMNNLQGKGERERERERERGVRLL